MTLPDARDRAYVEQLREALRELFKVIHRREHFAAKQFQSQLNLARFKGSELCHDRRAGDETQSQHGGPVREARRELFPVRLRLGAWSRRTTW